MKLIHGDSLKELKNIPDCSIDAVVTDPPYEIAFLDNKWDSSGIAFNKELWVEVLRVLKPGAHLVSFGASRTFHRMVCALEDAGFEIRDQLNWIYSSGMPKSKKLGSGWGTALKPAHEPICLARKPIQETTTKNFNAYGTGGLNIDANRIPYQGDYRSPAKADGSLNSGGSFGCGLVEGFNDAEREQLGRWPSNILLSHNPDCGESCSTDCPVLLLDQTDNSSRFFPIFKFQPKANKKERGEGNTHSTVKPIALMDWLMRLVTPIGGTVLDPFMGSGTTGISAIKGGFDFIGIELQEEHYKICQARIPEPGYKMPWEEGS